MRHAALNRSGPVSPRSKGATVMPSRRRAESLSRLQDVQIIAAHSENVEGVELDFMVVLAGVQRVKVADDIHDVHPILNFFYRFAGDQTTVGLAGLTGIEIRAKILFSYESIYEIASVNHTQLQNKQAIPCPSGQAGM